MRVVFLGNAPWSVPSLEAVASSAHRVDLVVTRSARPAGRGNRPTRTAVAETADRLGFPLTEVDTVKRGDGFEAIRAAEPDVLVVVAYGEILPAALLEVPVRASVNVHFSLLPELRGAAPVQRAILEGLTVTGVTTMRMDAGMDTGPILLQAEEAIDPDDDAGTLGARLAAIGGRLLVDTLDRMQAGVLDEAPQDDALATVAPKIRPADRVIDWAQPAERIARLVRAMAPEPGATTAFRGRGLRILRAGWTDHETRGARPGEVVEADPKGDGPLVAAGEGMVRLEEVQPEGRARMSGAAFVRGYRPEVGDRLGEGAEPPG
jgi:methionyl-tRNA formyltransferase